MIQFDEHTFFKWVGSTTNLKTIRTLVACASVLPSQRLSYCFFARTGVTLTRCSCHIPVDAWWIFLGQLPPKLPIPLWRNLYHMPPETPRNSGMGFPYIHQIDSYGSFVREYMGMESCPTFFWGDPIPIPRRDFDRHRSTTACLSGLFSVVQKWLT